MPFTISSTDFREGDVIPKTNTCEGDDMSPELYWKDAPVGTKSFALIAEDPDAPKGTFVHWVVYDMPPTFMKLERGFGNDTDNKNGIRQGKTDFGHTGYGGPCPPKGHGTHRYVFSIKALVIASLGLSEGAQKSDVERAIKGHVLGEARITGAFSRN